MVIADIFMCWSFFFFFQAEDGIRDLTVTGVKTCALPISWCQTTFQLASWVLLKNVALTAKQFFPRTVSARTRTGADPANSRTIGTESRFLAAYVVALR